MPSGVELNGEAPIEVLLLVSLGLEGGFAQSRALFFHRTSKRSLASLSDYINV